MPKRLPEAKRKKIKADIGSGMSRNAIARKHGVSASCVGKIADEAGIADAWDRTHTIKGAHAKAADNKARRAQLASDLLDDAQRLRARAWSPYSVAMSTPQGVEVIELELPPLPDVRSAYTAIGIASDKTIAIEKHDSSDGTDHAKSVLGALGSALEAAAASFSGAEASETADPD